MTAKFNPVEFYNRYVGKVSCAFKDDIYLDSGTARVKAKRTQEPEKYTFRGLKDDCSDNVVLIETPQDCVPIEFETHDNTIDKKTVPLSQVKQWVRQTADKCKQLGFDYCIVSHGGTSDYIYLFGVNGFIEGREKECRELLVDTIIPLESRDFVDRSNLSNRHLIPIIGRPHWKPKYKGAIHDILEGKNPDKHNNEKASKAMLKAFSDKAKPEAETSKERHIDRASDIDDMSLSSILSLASLKESVNGEYYGQNPWHGSTSGGNFWVNTSKNSWHCFRCRAGGGPAKAIALEEGIIRSCSDTLDKHSFIEVLRIAEEKYGLASRRPNQSAEDKPAVESKPIPLTRLKRIEVVPNSTIKTVITCTEIVPGQNLTLGYWAECPDCGLKKRVFSTFKKTCAEVFRKEHEKANTYPCMRSKRSGDRDTIVDFEEITATGYLCTACDPDDKGGNQQLTPIFFPITLTPDKDVERVNFEMDIQVKRIQVIARIVPLRNSKSKINEWVLEVLQYRFIDPPVSVDYQLLHKYSEIPRDDAFFTHYFCPRIYGRLLEKKIYALNKVSPFKIQLPNRAVDYGVLNVITIGDQGQAKTKLAEESLKYSENTNSTLLSAENSTNRGLLAAAVRSHATGGWMIQIGEIPKRNNEEVFIDGYGSLSQQDHRENRGVLEEKRLNVQKAGTRIDREVAVRFTALANTLRPVSQYTTKHKASYDVASTTADNPNKFSGPDRRRFHHITVVAHNDTNPTKVDHHLLNSFAETDSELIPFWNNLRAFAWNLMPDEISWQEGIVNYSLEQVKRLRGEYTDFALDYGILSKSGARMFIVQLPGVAILHSSINEQGFVVVKKEHADWLYELYKQEFIALGLDMENDQNKFFEAHAQAIVSSAGRQIRKILNLLLEYGSQTSIERAGKMSRMSIWRKLNEIIEYDMIYIKGVGPDGKEVRSLKRMFYACNIGSGVLESEDRNPKLIPDGELASIMKKDGSFTEFGKRLLTMAKDFREVAPKVLFKPKNSGVTPDSPVTVTGYDPLLVYSNNNIIYNVYNNTLFNVTSETSVTYNKRIRRTLEVEDAVSGENRTVLDLNEPERIEG